jgi:hypothetical protein
LTYCTFAVDCEIAVWSNAIQITEPNANGFNAQRPFALHPDECE